ncbi:AbrB/MazE/SpoVT family DNA-binding domain-containing protein [Caenibacillus caldisaponilyticus]|uniref:AbrB/MazE/SpoVT family DNA-binding domain-containing protein n=1 Tax=Caenibacillus caldisaponilyticus TaxID=1674942 RepID=UPI0009883E2A|nr:AbrB/MazE/SpoVT family DNA-binding domain-containing protein [Caenibacillus caldisaponilyticus]
MEMIERVQKWGNSLAVRIPNAVAEQLAIQQGSEIEIVVESQAIKLIPKKKKPSLEELLAKITPENRHAEIDFGVQGNELI